MTFSVDVDFSPFQAGPPQDATARRSAGEGRGKDFAGSLLGVANNSAPTEGLPPAGTESASFSLLNFPETPPSPASPLLSSTASGTVFPAVMAEGDVSGLETPAPTPTGDINVPETGTGEQDDLPLLNAAPPAQPTDTSAPVDAEVTGETAETMAADAEVKVADQADADAMVADTAEKTDTPAIPANPLIAAETPDAALPLAIAVPNLSEAAATLPAAEAAAITGVQSGTKSPQPMAEPPGLTRRNAPAGTEPPTHADLTAELVSEQADAVLPDVLPISSDPGQGGDATPGQGQTSPMLAGALGGTTSQTSAFLQTAANPAAPQLAPTHAALVATATQLPDIVARATGNGQEDSIVVQLDPPELGRLSIDFKFDAQGLQHVTITAESPEAMRQLRQMHFELVQALERNGLSSQNMSFQHQNPQQNEGWGQQAKFGNARFDSPALSGGGLVIAADSNPHRQIASGGRLDLRL
jgi:flagellar hook-length control protein FliK